MSQSQKRYFFWTEGVARTGVYILEKGESGGPAGPARAIEEDSKWVAAGGAGAGRGSASRRLAWG